MEPTNEEILTNDVSNDSATTPEEAPAETVEEALEGSDTTPEEVAEVTEEEEDETV